MGLRLGVEKARLVCQQWHGAVIGHTVRHCDYRCNRGVRTADCGCRSTVADCRCRSAVIVGSTDWQQTDFLFRRRITMNSVKILHAVRSAITAIAELLVYMLDVVGMPSFVIVSMEYYGSILPNLAAVCASIYHTTHTLTLTLSLTLNVTLTQNLTLISNYLRNKHQYAQPNMSANWMMSSLRDQSAARCKNCRLVPIGYTDNARICQYATYWQ